MSARVLLLGDRLVQAWPDVREMDLQWNTWSPKADGQMLVVAKRLVIRVSAAAKRRSWQNLDGLVFLSHAICPSTSSGPFRIGVTVVPAWNFLRPAVQAAKLKGAAWAPEHDLGHPAGGRLIGQQPRPALQLEDLWLAAQAFADMYADVEVEAHLDPRAAVHLADLIPAAAPFVIVGLRGAPRHLNSTRCR